MSYSDPVIAKRAIDMDALIRRYFDGCNEADIEKMVACFTPDAIHYFPPGMYEGPFRGALKIAEKWKGAVETMGSYWTVDKLLIEPVSYQAVMEWTHFKTKAGTALRGIEWYEFDPKSSLISEIRAYYASPQAANLSQLELGGFDYAGRGYPSAPPVGARIRNMEI
ncbi:nuclear transport factor 2 family protein [Brucella intermedia]|uniref:nuclear transport factor 2 family protein n=1 Tax=Brucella intermedia TaxID=94625 RepID=UPI00224B2C68|nr:nuclear transport factor 2 family protein [Brucella intermedia]